MVGGGAHSFWAGASRILRRVRHGLLRIHVTILNRKQPSEREAVLILLLSLVLAVAAGIYISRNEKDLEPPRKRAPRKRWGFYANGTGAIVFVGVAYATWWV